ncbi:hypothetical protein Vadar_026096 [Vaccinium darrowii]|uniref:Uncharacterized protein n=1 Tax=Vaccinium darrowii TaxID=229202 RepID=A0ACB7Z6D5_9ERIC|nr:hypothetical protein Vadar_026096 [Vaccinium darrowii]
MYVSNQLFDDGDTTKALFPDYLFYFYLIEQVLYDDGDKEVLNLRKEVWEFVGDGSMSDEEQTTENQSPDPSHEVALLNLVH